MGSESVMIMINVLPRGPLSYSIKVDSAYSSSYSSCSLFCTRLCRFIKSEIMDGFWSSRCLNDPVDLPDKIGLFLSGAASSMVVKNGTKKNFSPKKKKKKKKKKS